MSKPDQQRLILIDLLRGLAIAMMFSYHFSFDLDYFGYIHVDFSTEPFWLNYRALIVSLFLCTMGYSLYLAHHTRWRRQAWLKRFGWLVLASVGVSLSSYLMYPKSFIFFGILHFIALASLLGLLFTRLGYLNLLLGVIVLLIGNYYSNRFFNQPAWQWFGLMTHRPVAEDYVPLFPWFGMVLIGLGLAHWTQNTPALTRLLHWQSRHPLVTTLTFGGRHSLLIYLLHQPIFLGLLYVVTKLIR